MFSLRKKLKGKIKAERKGKKEKRDGFNVDQ